MQVRRGAAPDDETRKLWLIVRALTLRAHRPDAFAGAYTPLEAGPDACAFLRGDTVLAATALRPARPRARWTFPRERGATCWPAASGALAGPVPLAELLDEHGIALFERV